LSAKLRAGEANLKDVEKIVHPLVAADRDSFLDDAARDGEWLVVLDVPLLLENGLIDACDATIFLDASLATRRARAASPC
jgi:dephospho-CoA kinase